MWNMLEDVGDQKECTKIEYKCGKWLIVARDRKRESFPHEAKLIVGNFQEQQLDTNYCTRDVFYL